MSACRMVAATLSASLVVVAPLFAQWPAYPDSKVPRAADGRPNFDAPTPRTADGKPDLSGVWLNEWFYGGQVRQPPVSPPGEAPASTFANIGANFPEGLPFQPWAQALMAMRKEQNSKDNPDAHCLPMGLMQFHELRQAASTLLLFTVIGLAHFAVITLIFARAERAAAPCTYADDWDPRSLPSPQQLEPTPRSQLACSLLLMTFYLLLWIGVFPVDAWIARLNALIGGTPLPYGFAPVWKAVSPLVVALMLTSIARDIVSLVRPHWLMLRC